MNPLQNLPKNQIFIANTLRHLKQCLEPFENCYAAAGILPISVDPKTATPVALLGFEKRKKSLCWNDFGGKVDLAQDRQQSESSILATAMREFREETCNGFPVQHWEQEWSEEKTFRIPQLCIWSASGRYLLLPRWSPFIPTQQLLDAVKQTHHCGTATEIRDANKSDFAWVPVSHFAQAVQAGDPLLPNNILLARFFFSFLRIYGASSGLQQYAQQVLQLLQSKNLN